ncbi:hypothetical protein B0H21DRAFT_735156 [Amylocystis lapponica]|nr:hypothetical protein B0H21DRAFT_735156 [Amylocystis lapponica]
MAGNINAAAAAPHQSDARFETTAAWAQTEASTVGLTNQIGRNANQLQTAAEEAATQAQFKEPVPAVSQLEAGLSAKTNNAASEGRGDFESAKAVGAGYFEQAKNLASGAIGTAQAYLPSAQSTGTQTGSNSSEGGLVSSLQSTAASALGTGKEYLASAQTAAQPHIDRARNAISGSTRPGEVRASTASLESGPHVVGSPYPETTTGQSTKVGEL